MIPTTSALRDPLLGQLDSWRGETIAEDEGSPLLYHADSSYYSQIVRLALEEKQTHWSSRLMDIHEKLEQLQPWYLRMSPGGCVPTLVHRGRTVPESLDIIRYVDAVLPGKASLTPKDPAARERMERLIRLHYELEIEDLTLGYLLTTVPPVRWMAPRLIGGTIPRLEELLDEHPELSEVIQRKIRQNLARVEKFSDCDGLYARTERQALAVLDELEEALASSGGPFACGGAYSLADVLLTCLLARAWWMQPMREAIEKRPRVAEYWKRVQARPSFKSADIWTSMRASKVGRMLGRPLCRRLRLPCCLCFFMGLLAASFLLLPQG